MRKFFYSISLFISIAFFSSQEIQGDDINNPEIYVDTKAQQMVSVIVNNQDLFKENPEDFKKLIKDIFEPMVDFRRVSALVMSKKYYLSATPEQRSAFIEIFKNSLLDTYSSTLAEWGDQEIVTMFSADIEFKKNVEVKQMLVTNSSEYPITYKLRLGKNGYKIINIVVNGVNLGLTFRNQFKALADKHDENIDAIISEWKSDANIY
ncbi:ABC transporter substrate-binding protein [SAR86 cluster bacterium]|nr:ABC transporter substrate-binding protein [SAR86 cluster bacterium]